MFYVDGQDRRGPVTAHARPFPVAVLAAGLGLESSGNAVRARAYGYA